MKNKKRAAIIGLAALTLVGGTLAYYNATTKIDNPFTTGSNEGTTVEKFNPKDGENWQPGSEIEKVVGAKNTGDSDLWVRIKLEENWKNANAGSSLNSAMDNFLPENIEISKQLVKTDGLTAGDGSVVYKKLTAAGWEKGNDGYYYWNSTLNPDDETNALLNSVTLCRDTDMGAYDSKTYYAVVDKDDAEPKFDKENIDTAVWHDSLDGVDTEGKTVYNRSITLLNNAAKGYAKDNYTLSITTEFIQADEAAAKDANWTVIPTK